MYDRRDMRTAVKVRAEPRWCGIPDLKNNCGEVTNRGKGSSWGNPDCTNSTFLCQHIHGTFQHVNSYWKYWIFETNLILLPIFAHSVGSYEICHPPMGDKMICCPFFFLSGQQTCRYATYLFLIGEIRMQTSNVNTFCKTLKTSIFWNFLQPLWVEPNFGVIFRKWHHFL
jgi:hypothetical protein